MISGDTILTIIVCVSVILLLAIKIFVSITCFNKKTECIKTEMQRLYECEENNEYKYWRRELRCHYLCLIPFVSKKNVKWFYDKIYHKENEVETGIYRIVGPSMIGMCLCIICLCGASWAWFDASRYSSVAEIKSATYTGKVTITKGGNEIDIPQNHSIENGGNFYEIDLESESNYEIKIEANGTGTNGYYKIKLDEDTYYTPQVSKGCYFKFKINNNSNKEVTLRVIPQWGTCSVTDERINTDIPLVYDDAGETGNVEKNNKSSNNKINNYYGSKDNKKNTTDKNSKEQSSSEVPNNVNDNKNNIDNINDKKHTDDIENNLNVDHETNAVDDYDSIEDESTTEQNTKNIETTVPDDIPETVGNY